MRWSAPRPGAAPEGRHARGRTMQLSQGQDRPPLMPEGAPPTAGVLRAHAALPLWWVGGIVHGAAASVNSIFQFFRNGIHLCSNHLPSFLHDCNRATLTGLSGSVAYVSGRAMAVSSRNGLSDTTALKLHQAVLSYTYHAAECSDSASLLAPGSKGHFGLVPNSYENWPVPCPRIRSCT